MLNNYPVVLITPIVWMGIGLIEVFSASRFRGLQLKGSALYFVQLDTFWRLFSLVIVFITALTNWDKLSRLIRLGFPVLIFILVFLLFTAPINGAKRWFSLGPINIHPAEFLKIVWVVVLAGILSKSNNNCRNYSEHLKIHVLTWVKPLIVPIILIFLQPDMSTAMFIVLISFFMYIYARFDKDKFIFKDIFYSIILGIVFLSLGILLQPYRMQRFGVYTNLLLHGEVSDIFGAGNQIYHILIGIARGGILGVGLGQSRQQAGYLVETTAFTDSISAVMFEEFGFLLSTFVILSYLLWYFRILKSVVNKFNNNFDALVVFGISSVIFFQAFLHFAVNLALVPLTGVTLPFISYGGSSMMSSALGLGIILSIMYKQFRQERIYF